MIGEVIVFAAAVALVATYIYTVNRFLRSDEHWNEAGPGRAPVERAPATAPEHGSPLLAPSHI